MQAAAHTEMEHQITLVVDCGSVVNSAQTGIEYATNFKRPMGGLWRRFDWGALKEVIKVKAHIEIEVAESEGWLRSWKGNQEADTVARKAAQLDRLSTESLQELGRERALQAYV